MRRAVPEALGRPSDSWHMSRGGEASPQDSTSTAAVGVEGTEPLRKPGDLNRVDFSDRSTGPASCVSKNTGVAMFAIFSLWENTRSQFCCITTVHSLPMQKISSQMSCLYFEPRIQGVRDSSVRLSASVLPCNKLPRQIQIPQKWRSQDVFDQCAPYGV